MKNNQSNITPEIAREITLKNLMVKLQGLEVDKEALIENILKEHNVKDYDLNSIKNDYENMFSLGGISRDVLGFLNESKVNIQEIAKYSREDDLNDIFLAIKQLNKLVESINNQHTNYVIFYK
ncbi:hypothetical protein NGB19_07000 [Staphylococcus equorum]|uniref:hypothetical protein n=1 Tax=Staphylococcus equorum TaxID=246432 RepID=UPI002DB8122D|nr:hypothetical protein [Staphylococcus equorum]MEB7746538.1 hypothetical protein [Staphylococcus equorum]